MILEGTTRNEGAEVGEHFGNARGGHVLGEIEPVCAEIRGHVRRAGARGEQSPASADEQCVVTDVTPVHDAELAEPPSATVARMCSTSG